MSGVAWRLISLRLAAVIAASTGLAGCLTLAAPDDAFFWPDERVAREGIDLDPDAPPADAETLMLQYASGPIGVTRLRGAAAGEPIILYCGGNLFRRNAGGGRAARKLGLIGDALLFDYPGYGDTAGPADMGRFRAVADVMADAARRVADAEDRPLIVWGHSLGGAVCAQVAQRAGADVLVLETTPARAQAMIDAQLGFFRPFVRTHLGDGIASVDIPAWLDGFPGRVVVLEAGQDETLAPTLSRALERELVQRGLDVERLVFPEAGHNSIGEQADFQARIRQAIRRPRSRLITRNRR